MVFGERLLCFNEGGHGGILWFGLGAVQERLGPNSESSKAFGRIRRKRLRPKPLDDPEPSGERERTGGG